LILAICGLLLWGTGAAHGLAVPMLGLDIDGQGAAAEIVPGETVTASVLASGIPAGADGNGLFGFGFMLEFDAAGLSITNPVVDDLWTGFSATVSDPGAVGATANRFGETSGPWGDGILLASFDITSLVTGDFELGLAPFTGPGDNVLFDGTMLDQAGTAFLSGTASIRVDPGEPVGWIPEPSAALVFAIGFAAMVRLSLPKGSRPT
jgi:hypothetical protein